MRNIKLTMEYDGARYDGWQRLGNRESTNTIEHKIVEVLEKMTGEKITLFVAVRTEAGVHAYQQIANFQTNTELSETAIKQYLNRYLPMDIAIRYVEEVPANYQAPLNVKSVTYEYRLAIGDAPSVFDRRYVYYCFKKPDVERMREAAKLLEGKHDFAKLTTAKRSKSTERIVHSIEIYQDVAEIQITIEANDFLHNMARLMVSLLVDIGQGVREVAEVEALLAGKKVDEPLLPCDSKGLFLNSVAMK